MRGCKYATEEERKAARKAALKRYNSSDKARANAHKFRMSDKGKMSRINENDRRYVKNNEWELIEGYDLVLKSGHDFSHRGIWVVHHRLENDGFSPKQLILAGMYYDRPPKELIWMTMDAHNKLHGARSSLRNLK